MTKLGEICRITSAKRIFENEYVPTGIPFIRGLEISDGSIGKNDTNYDCYISNERYLELKKSNGVPKFGDILITSVGTIGNLCYVDFNTPFYYKDGNIIQFTDYKEGIDSKYLYYYMMSPYFKKQLDNVLIGAVQKALTMVMLKDIEILLPNLHEQKNIANILTIIDSKISNNNAICSDLEGMAKLLYDYWFVQFDFPDENGRPYKSSGGKMVWNDELKREIPEGWEVSHFKDVIDIGNGRDHKELSNGNIPVYGSGGLIRKVNSSLYTGESVLIPRKGTLNNIMYVNESFWTVDTMFYTKMKRKYIAKYMYYATKIYNFERLNTGTGVPSMTTDIIYKLKVLIPKEKLLKKYDKFVSSLFDAIKQCKAENQQLASLRDFLLPMLMNGQVKLNK